jgi:topoisomerase-4 subunit A
MAKLGDLYTKNKNGKRIISVPKSAKVLTPAPVIDIDSDFIAAISSSGRLLIFQIKELPLLGKGKGLKIIQIPPAKLKTREEYVVAISTIPAGAGLDVISGKRKLILKERDLEHYFGERGRRGSMLPRGYRNVSGIKVFIKE